MNAESAPAGTVPTATGTDGVVIYKDVPRFFYMPSVIFNTTTLGTALERDLYQDYVNQFTGGAQAWQMRLILLLMGQTAEVCHIRVD